MSSGISALASQASMIEGATAMRTLQANNPQAYFAHAFRKGPAIIMDFQDKPAVQVGGGNTYEYSWDTSCDLIPKVYLHVVLPALSAHLGPAGHKTAFRVCNAGNKPARQDLLKAYSDYGGWYKGDGCKDSDSTVDASTLYQRQVARSKWRSANMGDTQNIDVITLNKIMIEIWEKAGGVLIETNSHRENGTDKFYSIDVESMFKAEADSCEGYHVGTDTTHNFLKAQRKLWACYSKTALPAKSGLRRTDLTNSGSVGECLAGMDSNLTPLPSVLRPEPYNSPAIKGRFEPTTDEIKTVAAYVVSYHWANSSLVPKGQSDAGILTLADTQFQQFDDLNINPNWTPMTNGDCEARWCNGVGYRIIKSAQFSVGHLPLQLLSGDYLFVLHELSGVAGRRYRELVGYFPGDLDALAKFSRSVRHLYIPMEFWFTQDYHKAFRNFLCPFTIKKMQLELNPLRDLIVVNHERVQVFGTGINSTTSTEIRGVDSEYSQTATTLFQIYVTSLVLYLTDDDRNTLTNYNDMFARDVGQMTAQQISTDPYVGKEVIDVTHLRFIDMASGSGCNPNVLTDYQLPTNCIAKYHIWFVRRADCEARGDYFNFSGVDGEDPITAVSLKLNENPRWGGTSQDDAITAPPIFFRTLMATVFWNSTPETHIYSYSYCMHPLSPNMTGAINYARANTVKLSVVLQKGMPKCTFFFYTQFYNVLYYQRNTLVSVYNLSNGEVR